MEHTLSQSTLDSLTDFMAFIQICPRTGESWLKRFKEYRAEGYQAEKCQARREAVSRDFENHVQETGAIDASDKAG